MGTVKKYKTPSGKVGYEARDSWTDASGKRRYRKEKFPKEAFGTLERAEREANAWLLDRKLQRYKGIVFEPTREPVGEAIDRWLASLSAPKHAPSSINLYNRMGRLRFGSIRNSAFADLSQADVQRMVNRWQRDDKLSPSTCEAAMNVLRGTVKMIIAEDGLRESPLKGVTMPKVEDAPIEQWQPEDVEHFLRVRALACDPWVFAWRLLFGSAMRIGELAALRWEDIDWERATVAIHRTWSVQADGKRYVKEAPKTSKSRRTIPLPPHVITALAQERSARRADDDGWLCWHRGRPVNADGMRYRFLSAVGAVNELDRITPHGGRHSGATTLVNARVPINVVQRILGHSDPAFTMRRYVHPDQEDMRDAVETLSALYRGETTIARAQDAPKVVPITKNIEDSGEKIPG